VTIKIPLLSKREVYFKVEERDSFIPYLKFYDKILYEKYLEYNTIAKKDSVDLHFYFAIKFAFKNSNSLYEVSEYDFETTCTLDTNSSEAIKPMITILRKDHLIKLLEINNLESVSISINVFDKSHRKNKSFYFAEDYETYSDKYLRNVKFRVMIFNILTKVLIIDVHRDFLRRMHTNEFDIFVE